MNKFVLLCLLTAQVALAQPKVENVFLVTLDGMRWQDVFRGADTAFFYQQKDLRDNKLKEKYWRANVEERRMALMPFLWGTVAKQGTIMGNRDKQSRMNLTNQMWFSYPGYNELLTGKADDSRINTNDPNPNPNQTILEVVNGLPEFKSKVAAFTSWDVFPAIINDTRSGVYVNSGYMSSDKNPLTEIELKLNQLLATLPIYSTERPDALTFSMGMEYIKKAKPRLFYFSFGETDTFAHAGEYAAYLNSAFNNDRFIKELWAFIQSDKQYKNKTALIIAVDHGRGADKENWKHHGRKIEGADEVWLAAMGPGISANGEISSGQYFETQVAQTIASLLGIKYNKESAPALPILIKP